MNLNAGNPDLDELVFGCQKLSEPKLGEANLNRLDSSGEIEIIL